MICDALIDGDIDAGIDGVAIAGGIVVGMLVHGRYRFRDWWIVNDDDGLIVRAWIGRSGGLGHLLLQPVNGADADLHRLGGSVDASATGEHRFDSNDLGRIECRAA